VHGCGMARLARVVVPRIPHHVTQRGNRRQQTFFCEADYRRYLELMSEWCSKLQVEVWAYCLMPNHVHLIAAPESADGLRRAVGEAHRRYTMEVNAREKWRGHLWQGRFGSYPMDEDYLLTAMRYVELNPVRAGLVAKPDDYPWSSARAHLTGEDDLLVRVAAVVDYVGDWERYLMLNSDEKTLALLRRHERTGRPLGSEGFVERIEKVLARPLHKRRAGRKRKAALSEESDGK